MHSSDARSFCKKIHSFSGLENSLKPSSESPKRNFFKFCFEKKQTLRKVFYKSRILSQCDYKSRAWHVWYVVPATHQLDATELVLRQNHLSGAGLASRHLLLLLHLHVLPLLFLHFHKWRSLEAGFIHILNSHWTTALTKNEKYILTRLV